jgi:hypothetical protein
MQNLLVKRASFAYYRRCKLSPVLQAWQSSYNYSGKGRKGRPEKKAREAIKALHKNGLEFEPNTPENIAAHEEAMAHYSTDTQVLANWLDISVVKLKGRLYPADTWVIPPTNVMCIPFPVDTNVTTLNNKETTIDELIPIDPQSGRGLRLITFSFKQYGHGLTKTWTEPFSKSPLAEKIPIVNLCFVEYGFLSYIKGAFISGMKSQTPQEDWGRTAFVFGDSMGFAAKLLLPNKFTGYAYIIDEYGRVRWRGCGHATEEDLLGMYSCAEKLIKERN